MYSIYENDDIEIPFPVWIPVESSADWTQCAILDVLVPHEDADAIEDERGVPVFSQELPAKDFIESRNDWSMVGDYVPIPFDIDDFLSYLDYCESQGMSYVVLDFDIRGGQAKGRPRRITILRKNLLKSKDSDAASDRDPAH